MRVGLDYATIEPTARLMGLEDTPELFARLRFMEREALDELARRRK